MQVFKFGGASVKDVESVRNVASILRKYAGEPVIVVISAMGKTTNHLEKLVNAYFYKEGNAAEIMEEIRKYHLGIAAGLFRDNSHMVFREISNVFTELEWALEEAPSFSYDQHYDQMVSLGEILSTKIISAWLTEDGLPNTWLDARGIIQTDNTYREGQVDHGLSESLARSQLLPLLQNNHVVITQGFIGGTSENYTTTLGREGSDYSAALLAYFCEARQVIIWKDVPGVLNADPKYFKNTKKIDQLTYHDAIELSYYGASVIHPRTIKPLQNRKIPLYVRSFLQPDEAGTVINETSERHSETSYILKDRQILVSIQPGDFSFITEDKLSIIFGIFSRHHVRISMMQNSAISFSVCADNDLQKTEPLLSDLKKHFSVLYNNDVQLMTIRNYEPEIVAKLSAKKTILLEQRTRHTLQMVMKDETGFAA